MWAQRGKATCFRGRSALLCPNIDLVRYVFSYCTVRFLHSRPVWPVTLLKKSPTTPLLRKEKCPKYSALSSLQNSPDCAEIIASMEISPSVAPVNQRGQTAVSSEAPLLRRLWHGGPRVQRSPSSTAGHCTAQALLWQWLMLPSLTRVTKSYLLALGTINTQISSYFTKH